MAAQSSSVSQAPQVVKLDNSGAGELIVPGINGVPLDFSPVALPTRADPIDANACFQHGANSWHGNRLTVREVAMINFMDAVTDKRDWHRKVFDETIVAKWRKEVNNPVISDTAFDWCISELRGHADDFEKTGMVLTLDTNSRLCKSDVVVSEDSRLELLAGIAPLLSLHEGQRDWHPGSDQKVLNLVHPSLFPLVYGATRVLSHGGRVDPQDILDSCGKGDIPDNPILPKSHPASYSAKFQWLPCDVEFVGDSGTDVRLTSYINNLHPEKHGDLYRTIEKFIGLAIPFWNQVLVRRVQSDRWGRTLVRIDVRQPDVEPEHPGWFSSYESVPSGPEHERFQPCIDKIRDFLRQPDNPDYEPDDEYNNADDDDDDDESEGENEGQDTGETESVRRDIASFDRGVARVLKQEPKKRSFAWVFRDTVHEKWKKLRRWQHPEPGQELSYEDWLESTTAGPEEHIEDEFRSQGLQVIVKLASVELTPEKPSYEGGSWHIEGMLNEHIVATAIYYYDVENITPARVFFRQEAVLDEEDLDYEQDDHGGLSYIFGTEGMRDEPAVQVLGGVATPQGRILAFPNTLQHQVGPFELADKTRPGHRRFMVLWLVDPHYRICSTANVPPQRHDWWEEKAVPQVLSAGKLPREVVDMVLENVEDWPMSLDRAKELRLELMGERTRMSGGLEAGFEMYNLCEH